MLFNSYIFIFVFLPVALAVYLRLEGLENRSWAIGWLVFAAVKPVRARGRPRKVKAAAEQSAAPPVPSTIRQL